MESIIDIRTLLLRSHERDGLLDKLCFFSDFLSIAVSRLKDNFLDDSYNSEFDVSSNRYIKVTRTNYTSESTSP